MCAAVATKSRSGPSSRCIEHAQCNLASMTGEYVWHEYTSPSGGKPQLTVRLGSTPIPRAQVPISLSVDTVVHIIDDRATPSRTETVTGLYLWRICRVPNAVYECKNDAELKCMMFVSDTMSALPMLLTIDKQYCTFNLLRDRLAYFRFRK